MTPPDRRPRSRSSSSVRPVMLFGGVLLLLTVPFWVLGSTGAQLIPGLPVSAFGVVCPTLAAVLVTARGSGAGGAVRFLRRAVRSAPITNGWWYLPAVLLFPVLLVGSAGLMALVGAPLAAPQMSFGSVVALAVVFLVAALAEEIGWSGFAVRRLMRVWSPLPTSIAVGIAWAAWHIIPFAQAHPSAGWVFWQCVQTVVLRVLLVRLFLGSGGSVFVVAVCHASVNLADFLFPVHGSLYDPRFVAPVVGIVAVLIAVGWRRDARRSGSRGTLAPSPDQRGSATMPSGSSAGTHPARTETECSWHGETSGTRRADSP